MLCSKLRRSNTLAVELLELRTMLAGDEMMAFSYAQVRGINVGQVVDEYSYNATGQDIDVVRLGRGRYQVEFQGLAAAGQAGGHVQVSPFGDRRDMRYCNVERWGEGASAEDFSAYIQCYAADGSDRDADFNLSVIHPASISVSLPSNSVNEGYVSYAWAGMPVRDSYLVPPLFAHNPWGDVAISRTAVGQYSVTFLGQGFADRSGGHVQVSGYGTDANRCVVQSWNHVAGGENFTAHIRCTDPSGTPADSQFTVAIVPPIHFSSLGFAWVDQAGATSSYEPDPFYSFNPRGGAITAARGAPGEYTVTFAQLNVSRDPGVHAQVTAYGNANRYCSILSHEYSGSDVTTAVRCFDENGTLADSRFTLLVVPEPEGDRFEPNDAITIATPLDARGATLDDLSILACGGAAEFCSVPDYYRWTAPEAGVLDVDIYFEHNIGDLDLELLDAGGTVLVASRSRSNDEHLAWAVGAGESYYVRVSGPNGWTNDYHMRYGFTPIASETVIENIVISPSAVLELDLLQRVDVQFDYSAPAGTEVVIFVRPMTADELSPNYAGHAERRFTAPSGSGSGWFTIRSGDVVVDRIRLQMLTSDLSEVLFETFVDANFHFSERSSVVGDLNRDGTLDAADIDAACRAIHADDFHRAADLNHDGIVAYDDVEYLVNRLLNTSFGDANLDKQFDSSDLIALFQKGTYEDSRRANSSWAGGDFNCDLEFDSGDLIAAFQGGRYNLIRPDGLTLLRPQFFMPSHSAGDADFNGTPNFSLQTELAVSTDGSRLMTRVYMEAVEPGGDRTRAAGWSPWETAYVAPGGQTILNVSTQAGFMVENHSASYNGSLPAYAGHGPKLIEAHDSNLVSSYELVLDARGDDAGVKTGVRVQFEPLAIELSEPSLLVGVCNVQLANLSWQPELQRGDADWDSHGPLQVGFVEVRLHDGNVQGRAYLHAQEWNVRSNEPQDDFTTFDGWSPWTTLYSGDVIQILSDRQAMSRTRPTTDPDLGIATSAESLSDLVRDIVFGSDLPGADTAQIEIRFNPIPVQRANCEETSLAVPLRSQFLMPSLVSSDRDFGGNGPEVIVRTQLRTSSDGTSLETQMVVSAVESSGNDPTTALGVSPWETAYVAPRGQRIAEIVSPTESYLLFIDTDHEADEVAMSGEDLVDRFIIVGDTNGDDAGVRTSVTALFRPARIRLEPVGSTTSDRLTFRPHPITYNVPLVRGDDNFDSTHGMRFESFVEMRVVAGALQSRVYANILEGDTAAAGDLTTFDGWSNWQTISTGLIPAGKQIKRVLTSMSVGGIQQLHSPIPAVAFLLSSPAVDNVFFLREDSINIQVRFDEINVELEDLV